jgi:hypothetical protein
MEKAVEQKNLIEGSYKLSTGPIRTATVRIVA